MAKNLAAVVTQTLSERFYFPLWHKYYSSHFGEESLYVVNVGGGRADFSGYRLGGLINSPDVPFEEGQRSRSAASLVASLLEYYEIVIFCDTDEFLVPDPRRFGGLRDYCTKMKGLYVTATGIDVFQKTNESVLDLDNGILVNQRKFAYLNASLNKTLLTRVPLKWGVGFHFSSVYPKFNDCYLFHLKMADLESQVSWQAFMSGASLQDEKLYSYYSNDREKMLAKFQNLSQPPISPDGWSVIEDPTWRERFLNAVALDPRDSIYRGQHFASTKRFELPAEFRGAL